MANQQDIPERKIVLDPMRGIVYYSGVIRRVDTPETPGVSEIRFIIDPRIIMPDCIPRVDDSGTPKLFLHKETPED